MIKKNAIKTSVAAVLSGICGVALVSIFLYIWVADARQTMTRDQPTSSECLSAKTIYLAGGCFWGVEKFFTFLPGVLSTEVGYANGRTNSPTYEEVCSGKTNHAEAVKVIYNPRVISLPFLLEQYYTVIDPTAHNKQGNDMGVQYRTGIYYTDVTDKPQIVESLAKLQKLHTSPIAIELAPLKQYAPAEAYHQEYLTKNAGGYCHISPDHFRAAKQSKDPSPLATYAPKSDAELKQTLTPMQYKVTRQSGTEPAFENEYWNTSESGIYVDVTTGEPLFLSSDKFDSHCGWPSFTKPLSDGIVQEKKDLTNGMTRTEVRTQNSDIHLGHVFTDGPKENGGNRYCINSAALRFIPKAQMKALGYGEFLPRL